MNERDIESMIEDDHDSLNFISDTNKNQFIAHSTTNSAISLNLKCPSVKFSPNLHTFYTALTRKTLFFHRPDYSAALESAILLCNSDPHYSFLLFVMNSFVDEPTEILFKLIKSKSIFYKMKGTKLAEDLHSLCGSTLSKAYDSVSLTYDEYFYLFEDLSQQNIEKQDSPGVDQQVVVQKIQNILNYHVDATFFDKFYNFYVEKIKSKKNFDFISDFNEHKAKSLNELSRKYNFDLDREDLKINSETNLNQFYSDFRQIRLDLIQQSIKHYEECDMKNTQKMIKGKLACFYLEIGQIVDACKQEKQIQQAVNELEKDRSDGDKSEKQNLNSVTYSMKYTEWGKWLIRSYDQTKDKEIDGDNHHDEYDLL